MKRKPFEKVRRFLCWLLGAPFQELPPEFGDPVPVELRIFAAEVAEIQHHPLGQIRRPPLLPRERI